MAYEGSPVGRQDPDLTDPFGQPRTAPDNGSRFPGPGGLGGQPGFRDEPDFHARPGYQTPAYAAAGTGSSELDDDDDFDDGSGRDQLGFHWIWESLLVLAVGVLVVLIWQAQADALRGSNLSALLVVATGYALLGIAAGVSLRANAPNLAIGPVAAAAAVYFAERGSDGVAAPTVTAVVVAAAVGVALALVVTGLQVPSWAASLAGAAGVVVWLHQQPSQVPLSGEFDPTSNAALLFVVIAAIAIVGGLLGTLAPVRRAVGRFRPDGDPAERRGVAAAVVTGLALVASMAFAVVGGVILAAGADVPVPGSSGTRWLELTVIGFAVALIGGTSAFGRRGGVFGTVLAVVALVLFDRYQQLQGWGIAPLATAAVALVAGLVVTRLVERFGRPAPEDAAGWSAPPAMEQPAPAAAGSWMAGGTDSWASSLPAKPVPEQPTGWDDRWGR